MNKAIALGEALLIGCALAAPASAQSTSSSATAPATAAAPCKNPHWYEVWKDQCPSQPSPAASNPPVAVAPTDWQLGNVVSIKMTSFADAKVKPPSAQVLYGRLKFHFANGDRFGDILNDKQSWWSRFRPTSSAIAISVSAKETDTAGSQALLPTTILRSYDKPQAQNAANAQSLVQNDDVVTPWVRLDGSTKLAFDLKVESSSSANLQVLEQTVGQAANVYASLNPGKTNLVGKLSATAINTAAAQADQLIQSVFDPDSDKHRVIGADQLFFTPVAGDRKLIEVTFTDDNHASQPFGVLQVGVEFARSITDTAPLSSPDPYPPGTKLDPATRVLGVKVAATNSTALAIEQLDKYIIYLQQLGAANLSAASATGVCQSLATTASDDWNLNPLDTARVVLETDQVAFDNQVDVNVKKALDTSKCLNATRRNILSAVSLGFNSPPQISPNILPPDLAAIGHKIAYGNDASKENFSIGRFGDTVSVNYALSNYALSGSFDYPQDQVVDALKGLGPTAYCCVNGDRANARVTLLVQIGSGSSATAAAIDFTSGSAYDSHVNVINIRDLTPDELKRASAGWSLKAPSTTQASTGPNQPSLPAGE